MSTTERRDKYLSVTETAKLVRQALKREFAGTKFSVRSEKYAGGASINVGWTDGPTESEVNRVVGVFAGADFDGMVDLKVYCDHWLHPDGTVTLAKRPATNGSFVEILDDPVGPTAELVHFGADFIPTSRSISEEWRNEVLDEFERVSGETIPREDRWSRGPMLALNVTREGELLRMVETEREYVDVLVHRYTAVRRRG